MHGLAIYFNPADYDHLPVNYQPPPDGSPGFRNGKAALLADLPVSNLPRGLIPKRGLHVQPPRFHYGWAFSLQELFETANRSGFAGLRANNLPPGTEPGLDTFSAVSTLENLVNSVREKLGISTCTPDIVTIYWKKRFFISLTNNYKRGNIPPPAADVEVLRNFLGMDESPAWFLDAQIHQWDVRMFPSVLCCPHLSTSPTPQPLIHFNPANYEHLPVNYQPPQDGSAGFRNGKVALIAELPAHNLPKGLIPKRGLHIQPPRFQYGWAFSLQELLDTATRSGFAGLRTKELPPGVETGLEMFSACSTHQNLVQCVREKLGISSCIPDIVCVYSKKRFCITLTSNYKRGNIPPPAADVEAIRDFLGMDKSPAWFLEAQGGNQWDVRIF